MADDNRGRISLTVPIDMMVALDLLCERSGLRPTTQAAVLLRQALSQTINSEKCQERIRQARAYMTSAEWRSDRTAMAQMINAVRYEEQAHG